MISAPDATQTPTIQGEEGGAGDELFRRDGLVSRVLHPIQVAIPYAAAPESRWP